jgi:aspartate aminotransferase
MYHFQERNEYFQELFDRQDLAIMGRNTNHFPNVPEIKEAMISAIQAEEYHNYAPPCGIRELQELILKDLQAPGCYALVTNGATEALYQVTKVFLGEGDDFVSTDPGYFITHNFGRQSGANLVEIPIYSEKNEYKLTPELLKMHITPKTKMIYLVDPNNPLGSCLREEEIIEICEIAKKAGAFFVQDCTYKDFSDGHFPAVRYYPEGAIAIYSVSKWCGLAGMRIGAIVSHPSVIDRLTRAQMNNLGSNLVSQRGAIAALRTKSRWFKEVFDLQRRHQSILNDLFKTLPGFFPTVYPAQTNFLTIDVSGSGFHPEFLSIKLLDKGIQVRHAAYNSRLYGDRFFRVGSTVPREWNDRFCTEFSKIVKENKPAKYEPAKRLF